MDQVKFVKEALKNFTWSTLEYLDSYVIYKYIFFLKLQIPPQLAKNTLVFDFLNRENIETYFHRYESILRQLQCSQEKILKILKENDVAALRKFLEDDKVSMNEKLSKAYPITPLNYAASMVGVLLSAVLKHTPERR